MSGALWQGERGCASSNAGTISNGGNDLLTALASVTFRCNTRPFLDNERPDREVRRRRRRDAGTRRRLYFKCYLPWNGRVAQRESACFTRKRSQVQTLPRPLHRHVRSIRSALQRPEMGVP